MHKLSLLGLLACATPAFAQFAAQEPPPTASALTPVAQAPGPASAHPWYIKPEYGAWMICVKSYSSDRDHPQSAKLFAEALAQDIRERYRVPAYLFERGGAERQAERDRHARQLAQQRAVRAEESAQFQAITEKARAEAAAKGMVFMESKPSIRAATIAVEEQWAVLIGGWPDMATARREMEKVKSWAAPGDKKLMDSQFILRESKSGDRDGEVAYINPFQNGMVVPNPTAARPIDLEGEADTKFVMRMNSDEKYSVLKIQKNWTIALKQYAPPHQVKGKNEQSIITRLFTPKPDAMAAAGDQAREMVEALRGMKPTAEAPVGPFEAYVLHTRYGSLVCVGQFDGPEDPALLATQQQIGMIKFVVKDQKTSRLNLDIEKKVRLFDHLYAMKVRE